MSLQIRRGTTASIAIITPAEGEPIYATDSKQLFIGDGTTPGGNVVGGNQSLNTDSKVVFHSLTISNTATIGDIGFQGSWIRNKDTGDIYISPQDGQTGVYFPSDAYAGSQAVELFNSASGGTVRVDADGKSWTFSNAGLTFPDNTVQTTAGGGGGGGGIFDQLQVGTGTYKLFIGESPDGYQNQFFITGNSETDDRLFLDQFQYVQSNSDFRVNNTLTANTIVVNGNIDGAEGYTANMTGFRAGWYGGTAGYSFKNDGSQDTGMFSWGDGDLRFKNNGIDNVISGESGWTFYNTLTVQSATIGLNNGARDFGYGFYPANANNMKIENPNLGGGFNFAMKRPNGVETNVGISRSGNIVLANGTIGNQYPNGIGMSAQDGGVVNLITSFDDNETIYRGGLITVSNDAGITLNVDHYDYATDTYITNSATLDYDGAMTLSGALRQASTNYNSGVSAGDTITFPATDSNYIDIVLNTGTGDTALDITNLLAAGNGTYNIKIFNDSGSLTTVLVPGAFNTLTQVLADQGKTICVLHIVNNDAFGYFL